MKKKFLKILSFLVLLKFPTCSAMMKNNNYNLMVIQCMECSKVSKKVLNSTPKNLIEKYENIEEFLELLYQGYLDNLDPNTILIFGYDKEKNSFDIACEFKTLKNLILGL